MQPHSKSLPGKSMDTGAYRATVYGFAKLDTNTHIVYHLELEEEKRSRKSGFKDKNSILRIETYGKLEPP